MKIGYATVEKEFSAICVFLALILKMIVASACNANAEKILTEDMNHGQQIEGILIENPFVS